MGKVLLFVDPGETYEHTDPAWPDEWPDGRKEKSVWTFKAHKTSADDEEIGRMTSDVHISEYDFEAARKAKRQGKKYVPQFDTEQKMNTAKALILHQSLGVSGPAFVLPATVNHPLAGKPFTEITAEIIDFIPSAFLEDIEVALDKQYATDRSEEEQTAFRASDSQVV